MKKCLFLLCLCLLLQGLSGCMLSTVQDLPEKEETIEAFQQYRELFYEVTEELQLLWTEQSPHSISVSLDHTEVCAIIYHLDGDGYRLKTTELQLESESIRQLLRDTVKNGIHMDGDGIDFQCDGAGFGPNTAYSGVFYTSTEKISGLPFLPYGADRLSDPDHFSSGQNGDNEVEIERVDGGFFYYRLRYE